MKIIDGWPHYFHWECERCRQPYYGTKSSRFCLACRDIVIKENNKARVAKVRLAWEKKHAKPSPRSSNVKDS